MAASQRRIRDARDAVLLGHGNQLALVLAVQQVVVILQGGEHRPAVAFGTNLHVVELVAVHGRGSDGPHLALPHEGIERLHGILDGRRVVEAMYLVEIEVIGLQAAQRAVYLAKNSLRREHSVVEVNLRGKHHILAPDAQASQCRAQKLLARAVGIAVGRVEEVDAKVERMLYHLSRLILAECPQMEVGRWPSVRHAAHADARDADVGVSKSCVFHTACFFEFPYKYTFFKSNIPISPVCF